MNTGRKKGDLGLLVKSLTYLRLSQPPLRAFRLGAETALLSLGAIKLLDARVPTIREGGEAGDSPRCTLWQLRGDERAGVAAAAAEGRFSFLGLERDYGPFVCWDDPDVPRLWRFRLNMFGFATAMAVDDPARWGPVIARMAEDWLAANPPHRSDAWHPYVVAERLINLLVTRRAWLAHAASPREVAAGLWRQAQYLRAALEHDVGGNHLIREATALLVTGSAFGDDGLAGRGLRLLRREIGRQVLDDGGHFERSPSYHLEVLLDVAEARAVFPAMHPARPIFEEVLGRMGIFAASLCHPDGQPALFNDCSRWPVAVPDFLGALGLHPKQEWHFPSSGYYVLGSDGDSLLLDAGPPSPRDLPAHAHCDLLSFEVSVGGKRMIVNSGTGTYERGPWRDYWRSTRAHNTIEIDGRDQSEMWHSFRMASRAAPLDVGMLRGPEMLGITAAHNGYGRPPVSVIHRRSVIFSEGSWIVVDSLEGRGRHRVRSFLHLHPDVTVEARGDEALLYADGQVLRVAALGPLPIEVCGTRTDPIESWYASRLGEQTPAKTLVREGEVDLPVLLGWFLQPGASPAGAELSGTPDGFRVRAERDGRPVTIVCRGSVLVREG